MTEGMDDLDSTEIPSAGGRPARRQSSSHHGSDGRNIHDWLPSTVLSVTRNASLSTRFPVQLSMSCSIIKALVLYRSLSTTFGEHQSCTSLTPVCHRLPQRDVPRSVYVR